MRKIFGYFVIFLLLFALGNGVSAVENEQMVLDDLIRLSNADIDDEIIISQIIATESEFTLTTDDIIYLNKNGVSDDLIDFLINTPTLEEWEQFEDDMSDSDVETVEDYVETVQPTEEVEQVYRHIYIDVGYWDDFHSYWYWDTNWHGVYPIGFYCHNGRYYYYFGLHYWYYHSHCHRHADYYNHYRHKPPRHHNNNVRYKDPHGDRTRYKDGNSDREGHYKTRHAKNTRTAKSYQGRTVRSEKDVRSEKKTANNNLRSSKQAVKKPVNPYRSASSARNKKGDKIAPSHSKNKFSSSKSGKNPKSPKIRSSESSRKSSSMGSSGSRTSKSSSHKQSGTSRSGSSGKSRTKK
ncbi:MAG: hypothetical protein B6244_09750 [Candidatus Cloacimonetes bacterium 4572_55]|nr:MAG: hypothetical protein B6244_09750 [Candidatus Cloacimonetes bacterium 4572_55]